MFSEKEGKLVPQMIAVVCVLLVSKKIIADAKLLLISKKSFIVLCNEPSRSLCDIIFVLKEGGFIMFSSKES